MNESNSRLVIVWDLPLYTFDGARALTVHGPEPVLILGEPYEFQSCGAPVVRVLTVSGRVLISLQHLLREKSMTGHECK